jgi:hypothetical protein
MFFSVSHSRIVRMPLTELKIPERFLRVASKKENGLPLVGIVRLRANIWRPINNERVNEPLEFFTPDLFIIYPFGGFSSGEREIIKKGEESLNNAGRYDWI